MSIYIYTNGSIYSPGDPYATALLTENGTVTSIGSDVGARSITDERMRAIDLNGKLITPTFARAFAPINNHSEKTLYEYFLRTHTDPTRITRHVLYNTRNSPRRTILHNPRATSDLHIVR